jgi:hypothetical protein
MFIKLLRSKNMYIEQNPSVKNILSLFAEPFGNKYNDFSEDMQQALKDISPCLFRKWYCSAIIDDTNLSPANIIDSMYSSSENHSVFSSRIDISDYPKHDLNFKFKKQEYPGSVFLDDLKAFIKLCDPAVEFSYETFADYRSFAKTQNTLFNTDMYYVSYISLILQYLGLIKKMPSIHTEKYQAVKEECNSFFAMSKEESMTKIVDTALDIFVEKLSQRMEVPITKNTKNGIKDAVCLSCVTDELFSYVFKLLGLDFDSIADLQNTQDVSEEDEMLITSVMYAGVLIDKWFFTPLGYYMGLFRQMYTVPYNLREELDFISPVLLTGCDMSAELFSPCNLFYMLPGTEKIWGKPQENDSPKLKDSIPEKELKNIVEAGHLFEIMYYNSLMNSCYRGYIYRFKIYIKNSPEMWKIIDMPADSTLYEFGNEINTYFGLFENDFAFEYNKNEYSSRSRHRKLNSLKSTLSSLKLNMGSKLTYISDGDRANSFIIESSKKIKSEPVTIYPRLFRQSREITLSERNDEF